jgi:hypothetical protein
LACCATWGGADAALIFCAVAISVNALAFGRYAPESYRRH